MKRTAFALACTLSACPALSLASLSLANASTSEAQARSLFQQGNLLVEQAKYYEALEKFEAAYGTWANPKIQLNIATTLRALGRHAEALAAYRLYLRDGQPSRERRAEVERICEELTQHVAEVTLAIDPRVQRVSLDGRLLSTSPSQELVVQPGRHVLLAESAHGQQVINFEVAARERRALALSIEPDTDSGAPGKKKRPLVNPATNLPHSASATTPPVERELPEAAQDKSTASAHSSGLGILARLDLDGSGHGAVGAAGLGYAFDSYWQLGAGALIGRNRGAWAGLELTPFSGRLRPMFGVSAPMFFVETPRVGVAADAGARWELASDVFYVSVRAALVHFPSVPDGYLQTVFVPSLGTEFRL